MHSICFNFDDGTRSITHQSFSKLSIAGGNGVTSILQFFYAIMSFKLKSHFSSLSKAIDVQRQRKLLMLLLAISSIMFFISFWREMFLITLSLYCRTKDFRVFGGKSLQYSEGSEESVSMLAMTFCSDMDWWTPSLTSIVIIKFSKDLQALVKKIVI